jgi:hypothetical protein
MSMEEFERIIPVNPPIVKRKINPKAHIKEGLLFVWPPKIVINHLNTLIPVGTAMIIVAAVK